MVKRTAVTTVNLWDFFKESAAVALTFKRCSNYRNSTLFRQAFTAKRQDEHQFLYRGTAAVFVLYETTEVTLEEEYVLLDLPALIAAVGGFVGMILGWSAKDLARIVFERLDQAIISQE